MGSLVRVKNNIYFVIILNLKNRIKNIYIIYIYTNIYFTHLLFSCLFLSLIFQKHTIFLSIIFVRKILYFLKFYSNTCQILFHSIFFKYYCNKQNLLNMSASGILHNSSYHTDDKFSTSPHRTSESCLCKMLSNVKSQKFI